MKNIEEPALVIGSQQGHLTKPIPGGNVIIQSGVGAAGTSLEGDPVGVPGENGDIVFRTGLDEAIRFKGNGDVLVRGNKVATDMETYLGLREWLATALYRHEKDGCTIKGH